MQDDFRIHEQKIMEVYRHEPMVKQNTFVGKTYTPKALPTFEESKGQLPEPVWPANELAIKMYWKAWELAFKNLRQPQKGSKFVENYIDTAFNDCIFMWDSVFILKFARYGRRVFDFQKTLDNFYACQHPDGFICREIRADSTDQWHRFDPASTGPPLLAWAEWEHYQQVGDKERLKAVFPALVAYHAWFRKERSWPDGGYWSTGLSCGMDNMQRLPKGADQMRDHGWMTWVDTTFQAQLQAYCLIQMLSVIPDAVADLSFVVKDSERLSEISNRLWDGEKEFYCDLTRDGKSTGIRHVGGLWALLVDAAAWQYVSKWLLDPKVFWRPHPVPSLAADEKGYDPTGGYWLGGVWAPTNYMILRGLWNHGSDDIAYQIAQHHYDRVLEVFRDTGTLWENYAPESSKPGKPAKADFVGWSGIPPIAVLFEAIFGIRPSDAKTLVWDIRLTDAFGVNRYPLGLTNELTLWCEKRTGAKEEPKVKITCKEPVTVEIRWNGQSKTLQVTP